jgi:hypothetical protein
MFVFVLFAEPSGVVHSFNSFDLEKIDKAKIPQVFLHFCLTPRNPAKMKGTENKFKLLSVRLY